MKTKFGLITIAVLMVLALTLAVGYASEQKVIKWTGQYWAPSTMPYGPFGEDYAGLNAMYKVWPQRLNQIEY